MYMEQVYKTVTINLVEKIFKRGGIFMKENTQQVQRYRPLSTAAGLGSMLGSACIVGLSATLPVWEAGLNLTVGQVGIVSGALTFAIAFGSLFTGQITKLFGLINSFNWANLFYAIGTVLIIFANNFSMLLMGAIIMGFTSGADLPISLSVVSHDSPDESTSAKLVSSTQIYWQIGVFISYIASFVMSGIDGLLGARLVYVLLFAIAISTWIWRSKSKKINQLHEEADAREVIRSQNNETQETMSIKKLFTSGNNKFVKLFFAILVFYVLWNLLANTWGQFQTYALTNTGATQTQATGLGIILNIVSLITTIIFSSVAGGKYRNIAFSVGIFIQLTAMLGMAILSEQASFITLAITIGLYNVGNPLAGEAIYKVWTQESFPSDARPAIQGFINGFSRMMCGLFAFVTPYLVAPERIQSTMYIFAGFVLIAGVSGFLMMRLQKKHLNIGGK